MERIVRRVVVGSQKNFKLYINLNLFRILSIFGVLATCGGTFDIGTLENTTFTSPGYPNGYSQNLNCTWIFSTPPMNHLHLTFLDINLSNYASNFCIGDYIMLYNKNPEDQTWKYFKRFCRTNPSTTKLIEMSSEVKLQFITNSVRNETGFKLYVFER